MELLHAFHVSVDHGDHDEDVVDDDDHDEEDVDDGDHEMDAEYQRSGPPCTLCNCRCVRSVSCTFLSAHTDTPAWGHIYTSSVVHHDTLSSAP